MFDITQISIGEAERPCALPGVSALPKREDHHIMRPKLDISVGG